MITIKYTSNQHALTVPLHYLVKHKFSKITTSFCIRIHSDYSDFWKSISQGSVGTQLRCSCVFSQHFITNFPQNVPVKKLSKIGQYLAKIWTKVCGKLFGPPCTSVWLCDQRCISNAFICWISWWRCHLIVLPREATCVARYGYRMSSVCPYYGQPVRVPGRRKLQMMA